MNTPAKTGATRRKSGKQPIRVAIACQGGGSHTAFTAGVLSEWLSSPEFWRHFRVMGLSGTSGGALCAGIAWSRLLETSGRKAATLQELKQRGQAAAAALKAFWEDVACDGVESSLANPLYFPLQFPKWQRGPFDYMDSAANATWQWAAKANPFGEVECKLVSQLARARMKEWLRRHLPLSLLEGKDLKAPRLRIGAANICEGWTKPIFMEDHPVQQFHEVLLASAAIPPLFQPVRLNGAWYWDGVYAHNPPVECLANPPDLPYKRCPAPQDVPQEIWVIQVNPEQSDHPPRTVGELMDRRNELVGNLSLAAELYHIDAMNWLVARHHPPGYRRITLRLLSLDWNLDYASKYDRSRAHIEALLECGRKKAAQFLSNPPEWKAPGAGVHLATLCGVRHQKFLQMPDLASPAACTTPCPLNGLCKTIPQVGSWEEGLFNLGQRCFEANRPAENAV